MFEQKTILVDSHCHLDSYPEQELPAIFAQADSLDVKGFLSVCANSDDFSKILAIARAFPRVLATIGIHPSEAPKHELTIAEIVALAKDPLVVGIGEVGLDYHYEMPKELQITRFRNHLQAAQIANKPLIIHTREAQADTLRILQEEHAEKVGGILHCFTESWEFAKAALDMGFYISFSGIVTFPKAVLVQEVAKKVPLDRLLVETDAPYLAPVPYRGKTNQPGYVRYVAEHIAKLRNISFQELADVTTQNFCKLFRLNFPLFFKDL